jgi:hypothetical protein
MRERDIAAHAVTRAHSVVTCVPHDALTLAAGWCCICRCKRQAGDTLQFKVVDMFKQPQPEGDLYLLKVRSFNYNMLYYSVVVYFYYYGSRYSSLDFTYMYLE